jgi:hypothetical protein
MIAANLHLFNQIKTIIRELTVDLHMHTRNYTAYKFDVGFHNGLGCGEVLDSYRLNWKGSYTYNGN